ncbi:hypothetical protein CDAR_272901 [Caerostris darwini]|uniref:Uncharacterized protein n=1 Tax=Caerostris darwini TaxID=1538125 RepID=A0AAV4MGS0_9ARAC|nr:hypothetical protein CDAR_272901 [Caerostris darwini]
MAAVRYPLLKSAVSTIADTNIHHSVTDNHAVSTSYCNFETLYGIYTPPSLYSCSHVYLRFDCVQPYSGPHLVIAWKDKTFIIILNCKYQTVSIGRLKPAFFLCNNPTVCA